MNDKPLKKASGLPRNVYPAAGGKYRVLVKLPRSRGRDPARRQHCIGTFSDLELATEKAALARKLYFS